MQISSILTQEQVLPAFQAASKKQALQDLSMRAARISGLPSRQIFDVLLERERLGTTGVGFGAAIPHGRFTAINNIVGLFVQLEEPIDWGSTDDQPVDLIFLLLVPDDAAADHLQALACASAILRDKDRQRALRGADGGAALYRCLIAD